MAREADVAQAERAALELKAEADRLFPGKVREIVVLRHGDAPVVEPGEMMIRIVAAEDSAEDDRWRAGVKHPGSPAAPGEFPMRDLQREVARRLPAVRRVEVVFGDPETTGEKRHIMIRVPPPGEEGRPPADADLTPVMVRMRAPELQIVDTLISAGIAANRAEAVRWALNRISERPAYAQLRQRTSEIEQLKSEF